MIPTDGNLENLAEFALGDHFLCFLKSPVEALLHADLNDDVIFGRRADDPVAVGDRGRHRLFQQDGPTALDGGDRLRGVGPMRGADADRVELFAVEEFARIGVGAFYSIALRRLGEKFLRR